MIFVTIGTQEPFDRLIKAMDEIAPLFNDTKVLVQTLKTSYKVKNMEVLDFLTPEDFNKYLTDASLIVSHAGMGTIISSLVLQKPLLVMPRQAKYHEHRNEHQLATAKEFERLGYIEVAYNEFQLKEKVLKITQQPYAPKYKIGNFASKELINSITNFINKKMSGI